MNFFRVLETKGLINSLSIEVIEKAGDVLTNLGYTSYSTKINDYISEASDIEDLTNPIMNILDEEVTYVIKEMGINLYPTTLSIKLDLLLSLITLIDLESVFKEGLKHDIRDIDSNIEILNIVLLPYMTKNTSDLEFLIESVDDEFISYIEMILSNYSEDDDLNSMVRLHHIIKWLKRKFSDDFDIFERDVDKYFDQPMSSIMKDINEDEFKDSSLFELVYRVLISEDGYKSPISVASKYYIDHDRLKDVLVLLGEYNEYRKR